MSHDRLGGQASCIGFPLAHGHNDQSVPQDLFQISLEHHRGGRLREAERGYRALIETDPANAGALHWLGVLLLQAGQPADSLPLLEKAAGLRPDDAAFQYNFGHASLGSRKIDQAIVAFARAVQLDPDRAEALTALAGALLMRQTPADIAEAIPLLEKAKNSRTPMASLYHQLGVAYLAAGRIDEAIEASSAAVQMICDFPAAHFNLALAYRARGQLEEARQGLLKAVELHSGYEQAWHALAMLDAEAGNWQRAAEVFQIVIDLRPDHLMAWRGLATALDHLGKPAQARSLLREASRHETADLIAAFSEIPTTTDPSPAPHAIDQSSAAVRALERKLTPTPEAANLHLSLAAWKNIVPPTQIPRSKVVDLFDKYADRFDEHLRSNLGYRVPELIAETIAATKPPDLLDILDLGCGTGLCGQLLRPLARSLVGVDLAPAMVEKSRLRGVYDHLENLDLVEFLRKTDRQFDLLVAADVLIYVGDLVPAFQAAARVFRPGAKMIFSVEAAGGDRFNLQTTHRFAHSRPYLQHVAGICGFKLEMCDPIIIRQEAGKPVQGYLAVMTPIA